MYELLISSQQPLEKELMNLLKEYMKRISAYKNLWKYYMGIKKIEYKYVKK